MEIVQEIDRNKLNQQTADYIFSLIKEARASHKNVLLLLSGGSALDAVNMFPVEMFSPSITIGMIDERFSFDATINNFLQLKETPAYLRAVSSGAFVIDSALTSNEQLDDFAKRIEKSWKAWRDENHEGIIIALLGMGPDGHTAGIMPYEGEEETTGKIFTGTDRWVVGYNAGDKNKYPLRATSTFSFLRHEVNETIVYIAGDDKEEAFGMVMQQSGSLADVPARIFREMKSVRIFTTNNV